MQRGQPPDPSAGGNGNEAGDRGTGGLGLVSSGGSINLDGGFAEVVSLAFDPPTVTLVLDGTMPGTASYELIATDVNGAMLSVTAEALQFNRPDLASAAPGSPVVLTSPGTIAGVGTLFGIYQGVEATAALEVQIVQQGVVGTIDQTVIDTLNGDLLGADPLLTELLYPYDGTVFPLGLTSPLIMWDAPNPTGDVYRVRLQQGNYTYDHFEAVDAPGQLRIDQAAWERVTASNYGDDLTLSISRYDTATTTAYSSAQATFSIAPASLRGAIYYWTASGDGVDRVGSIVRIAPGTGAVPEQLNEGRCMGCHSVSADGSTLVATIEDPTAESVAPYMHPFQVEGVNTRPWAAFDLPAGDLTLQTTKSGANSALTPNGEYVVFGGPTQTVVPGSKYLSLAPTATGDVIADSGLDDLVPETASDQFLMPAFSPDGTKMAMIEGTVLLPVDNVLAEPSKRIVYIDFDQSVPSFNPTLHEVARADAFAVGNQGLGYPSFTPDSEWIAFHTGLYSTGCHDGCIDSSPDSGELWIANLAGTTSIRLDAINDPPLLVDQKANREPTFNPEKRGGYSWVVFTSMRNWGNEITGPVINGKRRLWLAAIDETIGTVDPSHPPIYIEGQENETPNTRGFWALAACIPTPPPDMPEDGACTAGFECCSGFCIEGVCSDPVGLTCVGAGEMCSVTEDCCNQPQVQCIDDICQVQPPPK